MSKVDLSEFLGPDLSDLLPEPSPELPKEVLSAPEMLILFWQKHKCLCGREYECPEHGPLIRHTLSRRIGFGLRPIGKVYIPCIPGMDVSDIPQEIRITENKIYACPSCLGSRPSLSLFPTEKPDHTPQWREMHKTCDSFALHQTELDMKKRGYDIEDTLTFRTTELDLQAALQAQLLCDPEKQIEEWK